MGRAKDILLYILIAVGIVTVTVIAGTLAGQRGQTNGLDVKWLGFAISTALILFSAVRKYKLHLKQRRFWVFMMLFFAAHVMLSIVILERLSEVGLFYFVPPTILEYFVLVGLLDHFVTHEGRQSQ